MTSGIDVMYFATSAALCAAEKEVHILLTAEEKSVQLEAPDPKASMSAPPPIHLTRVPRPQTARLWLAALERIIQAAYHAGACTHERTHHIIAHTLHAHAQTEYTQRRERMLFSVRHLSTEPVKDYSQQVPHGARCHEMWEVSANQSCDTCVCDRASVRVH